MAIVALCPECGIRARLADDQASGVAVCAACGRQFPVPHLTPGDGTEGKEASISSADAPAVAVAAGVDPGSAKGIFARRSILAVVAIFAVGGILWTGVGLLNKARLANDRTLAANLNQDAEALVAKNKIADARVRYKDLADFLKLRAGDDAELKKLAGQVNNHLARLDAAERPSITNAAPGLVKPGVRSSPIAGAASSNSIQATPRTSAKDSTPTPAPGPTPSGSSQASAATPDNNGASPLWHKKPTDGAAPAGGAAARPPTPAGRPEARPVPDAPSQLTDAQIGAAIQHGVDYLISQFDPKDFELRDGAQGNNRKAMRNGYHDGADVLAVYALMQCAEAINDPRLDMHGTFLPGCIEAMKTMPLNDRFGTYSHGLRSTALAHIDRKEDNKVLRTDVTALLKTVNKGAYTYFDAAAGAGKDGVWDNSNSQYGLLGVWSGAEVGIEVPVSYWTDVEKHWTSTQLPNGQWGYMLRRDEPRLTMTCAGLASLFVCHDWLDAPKFGTQVGREPFSPQLKKGLDWLEQGDNSVNVNSGEWGYTLYGIERVGLASGFKFFGKHNWYPELARLILKNQRGDGSWVVGSGSGVVDTAYALLFLSRGRHPVIMNKLRFDGYWANRPRDAANLAKYASQEMERPLNWQVVPLAAKWTDWTDSPILYLASHVPPKLSDADVDKIRQYVLAGGMLYVQADGDTTPMTGFAVELGRKLFPKYEMTDVPAGHPLFNAVYRLPTHPQLRMISNGSRILMLFSPTDISRHWQLREQTARTGKPIFQLGINMFVYSAGRRDMRNRLDSNILPEVVAGDSSHTIKIARVQYAGAWDPEPYAWTHFARWFHKQTGYALDVQTVAMRDLDPATCPFAHLTGTARYVPTSDEVLAVKKYVQNGGVLLIDLTGGTGAFDSSMRESLLFPAFDNSSPLLVQPSNPLLQPGNSGMDDLSHPRLRPYAVEKLGATGGSLDIFKFGKGHVLFTSLDITSGLLNTGTWGIIGYEPGYSQHLMKNAIFWTIDGQKQ